ncbi:hypothetical protein DID74_02640 [Candidatus Marinamargulisbacteria bacterium SCGC AG-333-B06]|nr:hypothetical protein DID74_02640 [Candidatus Marinamargulisbacteria bacterium SCGC AG-333-B06]
MDIKGFDASLKYQQQKQGMHQQSQISFHDHLVSKLSLQPGSISATEYVHKQSLLKAKQNQADYPMLEADDDESLLKTVQKLKASLTLLRRLERYVLGI